MRHGKLTNQLPKEFFPDSHCQTRPYNPRTLDTVDYYVERFIAYIHKSLMDVLQKFEINPNLVGSMTTDGAANMITAVDLMGCPRLHCAAHLINLVATAALDDTDGLNP